MLFRSLNNGYPVIKLQCLRRTKYNSNDKNKIKDFNPKIYKELHNDLKHLSDEELTFHFFDTGINFGRKYKHNQLSYVPKSIKTLLDNTGLQYKYFC